MTLPGICPASTPNGPPCAERNAGKDHKAGDTPRMCEVYALDPTYRKLVADQYLVFYHVNENVKVVEIHRVLRGSWNLPQYLE